MYNYLKNVLQNVDLRFSQQIQLQHRTNLINLLESLRPSEKDYVAEYVSRKEWNCGSPDALDILQRAGILKMTDYLQRRIELDNPDEVQLILNDLLETQFSLLANLIENFSRTDPKAHLVSQCLEEAFGRLIADLVAHGDCVKRNYLQEIQVYLSVDQLSRLRMMNLKLLMEVDDCSLAEGIGRLTGWIDSNEINENSGLNALIRECLYDTEKVLDFLMKKAISDKFQGWKWYSKVLKQISSQLSDESVKKMRLFLKELFASFLNQKNQNYFFIMMLTARIVCSGAEVYFSDYPQWYKGHFSEIRYSINKTDFISTIEVLQSLVSLENDMEILEMYAKTAISPHLMCNELVLSFKQMCRSKIERLRLDLSGDPKTCHSVILIEDDGDYDMEF